MTEPLPQDPQELRDVAVRYFQGRVRPFTTKELEELLAVSRFTILRYRQLGLLKSFIQGAVVRFHVEHVYALLMSRTV